MRRSRAHLVLDSERREHHVFRSGLERANDKRLDGERQYVQNANKAVAPDNGRPITVLEAVVGKGLFHTEVMKRIRLMNPALRFELSPVTNRWGIYQGSLYLGTSLESGMNPEFTPVQTTEQGAVATGGVRPGYRNALARLIRDGKIAEAQCIQQFGHPTHSSERWARALGKVSA